MGAGRPRAGEEKCECCGVRKRDYSPETPNSEARFCKTCREFLRQEGRIRAREGPPNERIPVVTPDGSTLRLVSTEEKEFYENRVKQYINNFDFNESSDKGLLSLLLTLEVQSKRLENDLNECKKDERPELAKTLVKISQEISKVQEMLGLARGKRKQSEALNVHDYFERLFKQYLDWKASVKNPWDYGLMFDDKEKVWKEKKPVLPAPDQAQAAAPATAPAAPPAPAPPQEAHG